MSQSEILLCIFGMAIVSYLPRVLPPFILAKTTLSPVVERWLRYVPTSVFGALVFSEIFMVDGSLNFSLVNINLIASLFVLIVAIKTRSLGKCIAMGLLVFWLLQRSL